MNKENSYKKLILRLPDGKPSAAVISAVMGRIQHARMVRARLHATFHGSLIILAVITLVPAISDLLTNAARSGFSSYVSLAISDGGSMLGSWQSFILSIVETAPLLEMSIILGILLILTNSLRLGMRYMSSMETPASMILA